MGKEAHSYGHGDLLGQYCANPRCERSAMQVYVPSPSAEGPFHVKQYYPFRRGDGSYGWTPLDEHGRG